MSVKSLDRKGRFRGKIVSFRCSEEENTALDTAVQLSGLTKQDYIISRVLEREITVQPNPISGRDQQEQKLILVKNSETLYWELQSKETELWKEPPQPLLEAIAEFITVENTDWAGTATELLEKTNLNIPVNSITKRLNVNASRIFIEYGIIYKSSRTHDGRRIELHYQTRDSS